MTLFEPESGQLGRDEVTGLGSAFAGGKGKLAKTKRRAYDFYPTPVDCTRALMIAEGEAIAAHLPVRPKFIWEPCGYGGAIARILHEQGYSVHATDIRPDPVNNVGALDLLAADIARSPVVITNMPFALAHRMIAHLIGTLRVDYCALLLKSTFWSTTTEERGRLGLWRDMPPARAWDMAWRPDFLEGAAKRDKGQGSTMLCSWFVWDSKAPTYNGPPGTFPRGLLLKSGPALFGRADLLGGTQ